MNFIIFIYFNLFNLLILYFWMKLLFCRCCPRFYRISERGDDARRDRAGKIHAKPTKSPSKMDLCSSIRYGKSGPQIGTFPASPMLPRGLPLHCERQVEMYAAWALPHTRLIGHGVSGARVPNCRSCSAKPS